MIDIAAIGTALLGYGPAGAAIAILLWHINRLEDRLEKSRAEHVEYVRTASDKMTSALVSSNEIIRANTQAQTNAVDSARQLAVAVSGFKDEIERLGETIRNGGR